MSDLPIDYLVAGIALELSRWTNYERMPLDVSEFGLVFKSAFDVELADEWSEKLIGRLAQLQFVNVDDDKYIGRTISTSKATIEYRFGRVARQANIFGRARANGREWLKRVFSASAFWEDLAQSPASEPDSEDMLGEIPASDRTVTVLHNSEDGKVLNSGLDLIEQDLSTNNEVADEAGEDRERLLSEVKASRTLLWSERLRVDVLRSVILKFLKEISEKFKVKSVDWGVSQMIDVIEHILKDLI